MILTKIIQKDDLIKTAYPNTSNAPPPPPFNNVSGSWRDCSCKFEQNQKITKKKSHLIKLPKGNFIDTKTLPLKTSNVSLPSSHAQLSTPISTKQSSRVSKIEKLEYPI